MSTVAFFSIVFAVFVIFAGMPKAEAASKSTEQILDVLSDDKTTAALTELVKINSELKNGKSETLKKVIFKTALEKAGVKGEVNETIVNNIDKIKGLGKNPTTTQIAAKLAESVVREQVKARLSERIAPYKDTILLVESILLEPAAPAEKSAS